MGKSRFLYNNLITSETMFTVSSLRTGLVSSAVKEGSGSATINTSGAFSGTVDKEYTVEIDSIAAGAEVGQATFRWSDGSGAWNATGVTTAATNILLNYGVNINWTTGSGADFVVGDKWYFIAWNIFNSGKMLDMDRDTRYRSATLGVSNYITVDFGVPVEIKAIAVWDHNFSSLVTAQYIAADDIDIDTPAYTQAIPFVTENLLYYLPTAQTYRYWRFVVSDASNPNGYIEIGELFLGSYLELSKNHRHGSNQPVSFVEDIYSTPFGIDKARFKNLAKEIDIEFGLLSDADKTSLETMIESIGSSDTGIKNPVYWNEDSAYPNNSWMLDISGIDIRRSQGMNDRWDISLKMKERLKSV